MGEGGGEGLGGDAPPLASKKKLSHPLEPKIMDLQKTFGQKKAGKIVIFHTVTFFVVFEVKSWPFL